MEQNAPQRLRLAKTGVTLMSEKFNGVFLLENKGRLKIYEIHFGKSIVQFVCGCRTPKFFKNQENIENHCCPR
jgi:hypothetical protein